MSTKIFWGALSALLGGAAFGLLVADALARPVAAGWVLLALAASFQLVPLLYRPRAATPRAATQPPPWFWLALLVMLAAFAFMRLLFVR